MADYKNKESINKEKNTNDVLGQVGYQMREIMATMYTSIKHILPEDLPDETNKKEKYAEFLMRDFFRLYRLAQNLAAAADLNKPTDLLQKNDDIVGLCRTIVERCEYPAEMLGLHLEFHSEETSRIIKMDADRIERLLLNLLSNAFKFTPSGGCVKVEISTQLNYIEIRVSDTGCGIASENIDKIFEKYQHGALPDGSHSGMGLGLPICRKIAQDHGGGIVIFSQLGEGTTAVVTLKNEKNSHTQMGSKLIVDDRGGFNPTILELSDALPRKMFQPGKID